MNRNKASDITIKLNIDTSEAEKGLDRLLGKIGEINAAVNELGIKYEPVKDEKNEVAGKLDEQETIEFISEILNM